MIDTYSIAQKNDAPQIVLLVELLIQELTSENTYRLPPNAEVACAHILANPDLGFGVIARNDKQVIAAYAGISLQHSVRVAGRYAIVQELYVTPALRGTGVAGNLLTFAKNKLLELGIQKIEVGLPMERYLHIEQLKCFYAKNGYVKVGDRMRLQA